MPFKYGDLAERWEVKVRTIQRWLEKGEIRKMDLPGRTVRFSDSEVERVEMARGLTAAATTA